MVRRALFSVMVVAALAGTAVAQDPAPTPAGSAPAGSAAASATPRSAAPGRRDEEGRAAAHWTSAARADARCLTEKAAEADRLAQRVDETSGDARRAARWSLELALHELEACRNRSALRIASSAATVAVGSVSVESRGCAPGDPLCSDIEAEYPKHQGHAKMAARSGSDAYLACYREALARRPDLVGSVRLEARWVHTGKDEPSRAQAENARVTISTIGDADLEQCLARAAEAVAWPISTHSYTATFTIVMLPAP
jgi:hypothetical protein